MDDLQQLIIGIVEAMGGAIEFTEYALAGVLLPEIYGARFRGRSEFVLAFDYDVAEEHPEAEFVTFGSEVMDTFLDIALTSPKSDARFAIVDRIEVSGAAERVRKYISGAGGTRCDVHTVSERPVIGVWDVFVFRARFSSSESFEDEISVWINTVTGEVDHEIAGAALFFEREPINDFPYAPSRPLSEAYATAAEQANRLAEGIAVSAANPLRIQRETNRIQSYYEELVKENTRLSVRKGVTPEREAELRQKREALSAEMERQIAEIKENLLPRFSVALAHGITVHIPMIEIVCDLSGRAGNTRRTFFYELLTKRLLAQ